MPQISGEDIKKKMKQVIQRLAFECEGEAKRIVIDHCSDTGRFVNAIWTETWENGDDMGFVMHDGVTYGIFHEFGTVSHFVPFYDKSGQPILANWAKRVLGLDEETMKAQGGMMVEIDETSPFRKALIHTEAEAEEIFKKVFDE